jgi:Tol biopolymer transport system component
MIGTTLSHYRLHEKIGEGGMGQVYRATDTQLGRDVAVKILPDGLARDPERLARFEREARLLASLNHANIATLHGFEHSAGLHFLVMELVAGETLAEQIARGPLAVEETVFLFKQVAEALEAAHERGVVHRDLKPANIKVTPEGKVKVLDFGLAKAFAGEGTPSDLSQSPTATRGPTESGVILGTAAYMSPEQARGKPVDKRTDIWAFGCVLFEALTGRNTFAGETVSDTIARILEREPEWQTLPATTPGSVRRLLGRCLEKDVHRRIRHIDPVQLEEDALAGPVATRIPATGKRTLYWGGAAIVLSAAIGFALWNARPPTVSSPGWGGEPVVMPILAPPGTTLANDAPAVAPDGRRVAFVARTAEGGRVLAIRSLDSADPKLLEGTSGASEPFWSPDSGSLGFFAEGKLKRIDLAGGAAQPLWNVTAVPMGGTWNREGVIVFSQRYALFQIPASGGAATPVVRVDPARQEDSLRFPQFLPDGRHFLFVARSGRPEQSGAYVGSLDSKETKRLFPVLSNVTYAPPGYLLFAREGTLMAQRFDPVALTTSGESMPIVKAVSQDAVGMRASFSTSMDGVLAYGGARQTRTELRWFDRSGKSLGSLGRPGDSYNFRLSSDEKRVAADEFDLRSGNRSVWILDAVTGTRSRLTFSGSDWMPVWSPDGGQILFRSHRDGQPNLYRKPVQPFPPTGGKWLVSQDGGSYPRWRGDGRELFYLARDRTLVAVEIKSAIRFELGAFRTLFQVDEAGTGGGTTKYEVTRDGQRFLVNTAFGPPAADPPLVVLNWTALLRH